MIAPVFTLINFQLDMWANVTQVVVTFTGEL